MKTDRTTATLRPTRMGWRLSVVWPTLLLLGSGVSRAGQPNAKEESRIPMPVVVGETATPIAAIYFVEDSLYGGPMRPIVLIWKTGRVVWSRDVLKGNPPYRVGNVTPQRVRMLLDDLDHRGIFAHPDETANRGPDYPYTTISIVDGKRRFCQESWHEFAEHRGGVATSSGIEPLSGRDRASVLAAQPERYRRFRKTWDDLRKAFASVIPARGRDAGALSFRLLWLPEASQR